MLSYFRYAKCKVSASVVQVASRQTSLYPMSVEASTTCGLPLEKVETSCDFLDSLPNVNINH